MTTNNNSTKARVRYFDMAKGVGILFVVVYHILGSLMQTDYKSFMPAITTYIVTIALPIFFITAGMQDNLTNIRNKDFKLFFFRKLRGLLVPFFTFSIISVLISCVEMFVISNGVSKDYLTTVLIDLVTLRGFSVYWFLPALLWAEVMFYLSLKMPSLVRRVVYLVVFVGILFIRFEGLGGYLTSSLALMLIRSMYASFFVYAGYELYNVLEALDSRATKKSVYLVAGALLLILQGFIAPMALDGDINSMRFDNSLMFVLSAFVGSIGVILLVKCLEDVSIIQRLLGYMGRNSLIIMGTHMDFMVLSIAFYLGYTAARISPKAKELVLYGTIVLLVIAIEMLWIWMYNNWLCWMIGKERKK